MTKKADIASVISSLVAELQSLATDEERQRALNAAAAAFDLGIKKSRAGSSDVSSNDDTNEDGRGDDEPKKFLKTKSPKNDQEVVACLGYFLANMRNTSNFGSKELEKLNNEAKGNIVGEVKVAVNNASSRQYRYFKPAGQGKKQMTAHGEQVVEALPDREAVKKVVAAFKKRARKGAKRKGRKKA